ncbi:mechanosensitive ion channel family protein [Hyphobacterium marinum]|uniref:Small-conductance mechanosensitive channel n=1 Tax=Hyphobacterium marinum TaxID=3116574 RepID=A0ABU7LWI0_9PROT|nr:mechanosensitive ion channel domain-containing protein [Hyphobacterium sp. Y6023]MEE2565901.1 mechanosensitive ion channel domain-containing protein [Hyphobacterium sp. Y6023]
MESIFNEELITQLVQTGTRGAVNVALALLILIVGYLVAGLIKRNVKRLMLKSDRIDETIAAFFSDLVRYGILVIVFIAVLNRFGVETTSLVAAIGAAALAIGLALQGTLSNVAAGVMIVFFRPYKFGDFVDIAGTSGTVKDINLFTTELAMVDGVKVIVPNAQSWGQVIMNYTANPTRRIDWTFSISYDDDIDKAISVIRDVITADERVHADPEPVVVVVGHGASSIDISARVWAATADHWVIKWEMWKQVKQAFDRNDIEIPYPHQVEIHKDA